MRDFCAYARVCVHVRVCALFVQMPKAQQDYYYSYARQNFVSFSDEDDPERVGDLIEVPATHETICEGRAAGSAPEQL